MFFLWLSLGLGIATVEEKVDKVLKELEELRKRLEGDSREVEAERGL